MRGAGLTGKAVRGTEALPGGARRAAWPRLRRALGIAFIVLLLLLLFRLARQMDWADAWQALRGMPWQVLLGAGALAAGSHALYSTFDLIGRHQVGHRLPAGRTMAVAFTSYAFNLNLGALVGGVAMRYRLYSGLGLNVDTVTRVVAYSMVTNWSGYLLLGGLLLVGRPPRLPAGWSVSQAALPVVGVALLAAALGYLVLCAWSKRREWRWRRYRLRLPSGRIAGLQLGLSALNWCLIGAALWVLMQQRIAYLDVLSVLLLAAVAGVLTHVPAGLGVLEAVFVAMLSSRLGQGPLLAALLAYRALYYLAPLALATAMLAVVGRRQEGSVSGST